MAYAGKAVRKGDSRADVVSAVQTRLNAVGCGPVNTNPRGSRDGYCVYEHTRPIAAINVGFLDYGLLDKKQ